MTSAGVSPLGFVAIRYSESPALHRGHRFDTIADFDAAMRNASAAVPPLAQHLVVFVLHWADGRSTQWRLHVERTGYAGVVTHVCALCDVAQREVTSSQLRAVAGETRELICRAAVAERAAARRSRQGDLVRALASLRERSWQGCS